MNEQIRLKAACFHWLGKAQDVADNRRRLTIC
jgi:hypothetical protein